VLKKYRNRKSRPWTTFCNNKFDAYFFLGLAAGFLAGAFVAMASSYMILLES